MGTWDDGLLDNDTALDGLGDLRYRVVEDIVALGASRSTKAVVERLGAAVGVLLQLSSYDFSPDSLSGPKVAAAVAAHRDQLALLGRAAKRVLDEVAEGRGEALASRPAALSATATGLLHVQAKAAPFGRREPSLFASKTAETYAQSIAKRCVEAIDQDFEDESNWSDLCREGTGMGHLAFLLVLSPCTVSVRKLERWRRLAQKGIAELEERNDEELAFHRGYYQKLDRVFALLVRRFSPR